MANILVSGNVYAPTSQACVVDTTSPTFAGIATISAQLNGSILATWLAATDASNPIYYDVYIQPTTATGLFSSTNLALSTNKLSIYIFTLADNTLLLNGQTYFIGIRARDPLGNQSTTLASLSAISQGVNPTRVLTPADIPDMVDQVWTENVNDHATGTTTARTLKDAKIFSQIDI
jgi:hypothetical protein